MKETPLKQWLDGITIASNYIYTNVELLVDMSTFYKLFKQQHSNAFKHEGYFLRAIKMYTNKVVKVKGNPKVMTINKMNYITLGLVQSDWTPSIITDINDNRLKILQSERNLSDRNLSDMNTTLPSTPGCTPTHTLSIPPSILPSPPTLPPPPPPTSVTPTCNPSVTPTHKPNPYPLLHSLGINTNLDENMETMSNLLSELVSLFKKSNKKLEFTHQNSKPGLLIAIPNAKNYSSVPMRKMRGEKSGLRVLLILLTMRNILPKSTMHVIGC